MAHITNFIEKLQLEDIRFPDYIQDIDVEGDKTVIKTGTTLRKKHTDNVWYKFNITTHFTLPATIALTDKYREMAVKHFLKEVYLAQLSMSVNLDVIDVDGNKVFVKDEIQMSELERLMQS